MPAPAKLFWSVTVYEARTRSQIQTAQGNALVSSLFDAAHLPATGDVMLRFGPTPPDDGDHLWVQTIPGAGWFVYLRLSGPEEAAFNGDWRPGDFIKT